MLFFFSLPISISENTTSTDKNLSHTRKNIHKNTPTSHIHKQTHLTKPLKKKLYQTIENDLYAISPTQLKYDRNDDFIALAIFCK